LSAGPDPPRIVTAYIEITPFDVVKYEVDKETGYLSIDRPQTGASVPPNLYGFIPRTYCGRRVAALSPSTTIADGDPLDICVISERPVDRSDITVRARVVGGLRMVDFDEADDKIVAILVGDPVWDAVPDLGELPPALINRLDHYFSTYKALPGSVRNVRIDGRYGREDAYAVIEAALADYVELVGGEQSSPSRQDPGLLNAPDAPASDGPGTPSAG
jgi:inorganic pyrophosphatase